MKVPSYSFKDCLAKEFSCPFLAKNDDVAVRIYRNSLKGSMQGEYELWQIGDFNSETGTFIPLIAKRQIFITEVSNENKTH